MNKVIIACDFENEYKLMAFLSCFESKNLTLKIGMELFYKEGPALIKKLKDMGYGIFLDLKLHDIPNTVEKAMKNIGKLNVDMVNVHAQGGIEMMKAAKKGLESVNSKTKLIAVTLLTSIDQKILEKELFINNDIKDTIIHYALNVKAAGLDGVVCSPLEAKMIHQTCGDDFLTVTPGIRLSENNNHDQKRVATPELAKALKTDFIVVGRSITGSVKPEETYNKIMEVFHE